MTTADIWRRFLRSEEPNELTDLRRDTLLGLTFASVVLGWLMIVFGLAFGGEPAYLPAGILLLAGAGGCFWLQRSRYRAALYLLVLTMLATLILLKALMPASAVQYFFSLIIVVSSLLVSGRALFLLAGLGIAATLLLALSQDFSALDVEHVVAPVILILLMAFAAWLGARRANLALRWLQISHRRAEGLVEELRDERMSLARVHKVLEQAYVRIEKMNYALIEATTVAEAAQQLKAEFAANVSHELRTPLNIIIGFAETMANAPETYTGARWSPELRGDVEQIYRNARHLTSLIDDILDLSALEVRRLGLTKQDNHLEELIIDAVSVVQDLFEAKRLYLRIEIEPELPRLRVDATRIRQVLVNLLGNASRFADTGGVTIKARLDGEFVEVAVCDTGIGIHHADIPRVFEDFGQVDGTSARRHAGTGLGVPLSKRLVELHGGRMWLASEPGRGTEFYFTLPVALPERFDDTETRPLPVRRSPYRKVVLLRERDPMLVRTVRRYLSSYDVIEVVCDEELGPLVAEHHPVALVVDDLDAFPRAALADGQPGRPPADLPSDLPVIQLRMQGGLRTAFSLGLENYLIKPVLREELLQAVGCIPGEVRQVLIVDDDLELADLLARMLQSAERGYRAHKAYSGGEALQRLRAEPVDLVLLDLMIGDMTGIAVAQAMRQDANLARIPVILVSGHYPETVAMGAELDLRITRGQGASITESLRYLEALVDALPMRSPRRSAAEPALSGGPGGQPAS